MLEAVLSFLGTLLLRFAVEAMREWRAAREQRRNVERQERWDEIDREPPDYDAAIGRLRDRAQRAKRPD